jgi:hypothetical protein
MLESADSFSAGDVSSLQMPRSETDIALMIENTPPGRYWVIATTGLGYVQALTSDGVDLIHQPLVVTTGSHSPIEVTVRDDTGQIAGKIMEVSRGPDDQEDSPAQAVSFRGGGSPLAFLYFVPLPDSPGTFQESRVEGDGSFSSPPLAPGSYRVFAFAHRHPRFPYRDADAMRTYETQGQVVHVIPGETERIQVHLSQAE